MKKEIRRHQYLLQSDKLSDIDKEDLKQLFTESLSEDVQEFALSLLSEMLYKHYGQRVVILIDEYDVPLDKAYQYNYYREMVQHIRLMFGEVLKTNDSLGFAVLTGCLRISKESIFTGLNNFKSRTISDASFAECFGFTDKEVKDMLKYYGMEDKAALFKEWYDGYRFAGREIYCPWSIINQCVGFLEDRDTEMKSYWINSSGNSIIKDMAVKASAKTREQIETLVSGGTVRQEISEGMTYQDLEEGDSAWQQIYMWSLLYVTGYLTDAAKASGGVHTLAIPNLEIYMVYEKQVLSWFRTRIAGMDEQWKSFIVAVEKCDSGKTGALLEGFLSSYTSIRDTAYRKDLKENFYHGFLLMALGLNDNWDVISNRESGTGYPDIMVEDMKSMAGWVFELKYAEDGQLDRACKTALKQAKDNNYAAFLKQDGMEKVHLFGIAFYKKSCKAICEKED